MSEIFFSWNGKNYKVGGRAALTNLIILPNGVLLSAQMWLASSPMQAEGLHEIHHTFSSTDPAKIALHTGGLLAEEVV
jgi:hypothetical protein